MKEIIKIAVLVFASLLFCQAGFAFTSISAVPGENSTLSRASNYDTQVQADKASIAGCRTLARHKGLAKLAGKCAVLDESRGPGYGAIVCGAEGCAWRTGYESGQAAVDAAYSECNSNYKNCQQENIKYWADFAGFPSAPEAQPQVQMQTPPSMSDVYRARWCAKQDAPPPECSQ